MTVVTCCRCGWSTQLGAYMEGPVDWLLRHYEEAHNALATVGMRRPR